MNTSRLPSTRNIASLLGVSERSTAHTLRHTSLSVNRGRFIIGNRVSQNVFAAVRLDGNFPYVLAGAEGRLNDASLVRLALRRSFRVPQNRFYLDDAGFAITPGILVPYPNTRYHLDDWRRSANMPLPKKSCITYATRGIVLAWRRLSAG